jgi:hypothetical protein
MLKWFSLGEIYLFAIVKEKIKEILMRDCKLIMWRSMFEEGVDNLIS